MAEPRAFVSFDFDHDPVQRILFAGQARSDSPTPFTVQDWSSKTSLPQAQWERLISQKISATHMCIVLVGQATSAATGVVKEIAMAKAHNVPTWRIRGRGWFGNGATKWTGAESSNPLEVGGHRSCRSANDG